jgi:hypothetical protein
MTRSYRKTTWDERGYNTNYEKQIPIYIGGHLIDLTKKENETKAIYKRIVFTNKDDGTKKHGKFLIPKESPCGSWICAKCNLTHFRCCDDAEKFIPISKKSKKSDMLTYSINTMDFFYF